MLVICGQKVVKMLRDNLVVGEGGDHYHSWTLDLGEAIENQPERNWKT
jgi:hypothetical protein